MDDRLGVLWGEEQGWGREEAPEGTVLAARSWVEMPCTFSLCNPPGWISGPRSPTGQVQMLVPSHGPTSGWRMSVPLWPHWGVMPASSRVWSVKLGWGLSTALMVSTPLPTVSGPQGPESQSDLEGGRVESMWAGRCPKLLDRVSTGA